MKPSRPLPSTEEIAASLAKAIVAAAPPRFWSDLAQATAEAAAEAIARNVGIDPRGLVERVAQAATEKRVWKPGEG